MYKKMQGFKDKNVCRKIVKEVNFKRSKCFLLYKILGVKWGK